MSDWFKPNLNKDSHRSSLSAMLKQMTGSINGAALYTTVIRDNEIVIRNSW